MSARVRRTATRGLAGLVGTALVAATLTGCGAGDKVAEKATEKAVEKAIESGASEGVDVDLDGEQVKVESSDGSFSMGGDVPEDFPAEVPLADGEVLMASSTPDGWTVILEVPGDFDEVKEAAVDAVLGAGFSEESRTTTPDYVAVMAADDTYDVMVAVTPGESGTTNVSYTVASAS